ncbi:hypothetical protein [Anatilimnocola floriformis]|uniref:hypothetical protein n=1 Tax=Anatilimnocola floriformis TaxID=2948575 RepID=UPI0020C521D4|nr:hypothetical protein [Anatilimnocola floriformis]
MFRTTIVLVVILITLASAGCGASRSTGLPNDLAVPLEQAATWELTSIDPGWVEPSEPYPQDMPKVQGYPALGSLKITDAAVRKKLLAELQQAVTATDQHSGAACFAPRHAITVEHQGKQVILLICFHCSNANYIVGGKQQHALQIAHEPKLQESLSQLLAEQKIPLAP